MSKLYETLSADLLSARKEKNSSKANLLSTLKGECMTKQKSAPADKPFTDEDVLGVVKKSIKNLKANLELPNLSDDARKGFEQELAWLEVYTPKMMGEAELTQAIRSVLINSDTDKPNVGFIMKELKNRYAGQYDGAMAKKLIDAMAGS